MQKRELSGGCLCGAVRFSYVGPLAGELGAATVCHCAACRRAQGYASAAAPVMTEGFVISTGRERIVEFESSPGKKRAFCGACGSPLYSRRDDSPSRIRLRLGALDEVPGDVSVEAHIFAGAAPDWSLPDDAPRYAEFEPDRS